MRAAGGPEWEALAQRLARLPANHRRVVVALLEVFARELRELSQAGVVAAGAEDVAHLESLAARLRGGPWRRNWEAVLALLEIQLEELQPRKLSSYGPLTPEQENTVHDLVGTLHSLLSRAG